MTEQFANNASTTLNGSINNSVTSVLVTNGAPFSQTGTFRVIVDSEIMIVTANSGNTFTVQRGQEGTAAASHNSGAVITQIVTAGALTQLKTDVTTVGVLHAGTGNPNTFPSFVQGNNASGTSVSTTASVTAGNLLVVFVQNETNNANPSPPTDSISTSYTLVNSNTNQTSQVSGAIYAGIAPTSAIVTVTGHQAGTFSRTSIGEYKNTLATVDNTTFVLGATSTLSIVPTVANDLILGIVGDFSSSPGTFTTAGSTTSLNMVANFQGTGSDSTFYESGVSPSSGTFTVGYSPAISGNVFFGVAFKPNTSVPASVGNDGDFFIDTLNKVLYGPRLNGAYPKIGTLN